MDDDSHPAVLLLIVLQGWWRPGAAGLALIVCAAAGVFDGRAPTGNDSRWRRIQTPELVRDTRIGEEFPMYFPSLTAVEISAAAVGTPRGEVVFALSEVSGAQSTVVRSGRVAAAEMTRDDRYVFRFRPVADSRGRRYRFEVSASGPDSGGVSLWATKGRHALETFMLIDGADRVADLVFQTQIVTPPPRPRWLIGSAIAMLAASWCAVLRLLREIAR